MRVTRSHRPLATAAGTTINHRPEVTGNEPVTDTAPRAPGRQALLLSSLLALVLGALALALPAAASAAYLFESKWGSNGAGAGQFSSPSGLATDASGNIYVADSGNNRIRQITPDGLVTTIAGGERGYADGPGSEARFFGNSGLVLDNAGNLLVAEADGERIRLISPEKIVSTLAGSGEVGFRDGPAGKAQFNGPTDVALDETRFR